ncbi:ApeA N-terminal domain 1-containing protein [Salinimicrobium sp. CAU 1759]
MDIGNIYMGYWWLPEGQDNKVSGNFIYDSQSQTYRLHTIGKLKSNPNDLLTFNDQKMIIGLAKDEHSNKNFSFKLLDGFATKMGPDNYSEYVINSFLICPGEEFDSKLLFNRVHVKVTYLDEWFANSGFKINKYSEKKMGYQVQYHQPDDIILFESEELVIKGTFRANIHFPLYTDFKAGQSAFILLQFKVSKELEEIKKMAFLIKNFFCLAIGLPLRFENFQVENKINGFPSPRYTYYKEERNKNLIKRNIRSFGMPINFKNNKGKLPNILEIWFQLHDKFVLSVLNYFGFLNENRGFEEDKFLNLIIAIETYQRKKHPNFENKRGGKFLRNRERVLSKIKNKNDYQWLSKQLKDYVPKTLKDRLLFILDLHKGSLKDLVKNEKKFVDHVVETRHHLVHEDVESVHLVLKDGDNLSIMNSKLKVILEAIFLSGLGFESECINKKLKGNQYNFQAFDDSRF